MHKKKVNCLLFIAYNVHLCFVVFFIEHWKIYVGMADDTRTRDETVLTMSAGTRYYTKERGGCIRKG